MDLSLDLSQWREEPLGVAYRRATIVTVGLRQLIRTRFFRVLLAIAWVVGSLMAAFGFLFTQSVASGGWLDSLASNFGPRGHALALSLSAVVLLYPDICIGTLFTALFWLQSWFGLWLSLIALTALVPGLVTRDRASNALTIYLSRPLTSADYLLGKLGIIAGTIVLLWTGPLFLGWLLSIAFAPDRNFLVYSFGPLMRALLFNGIGLAALAGISLGVSAVARSSRTAIVLWLGLWLVAGIVAAPPFMPAFVRRASFSNDLIQIRQEVFRLDEALTAAGDQLPILDRQIASRLDRAGENARPMDFTGALAGLAVLTGLSSVVFLRKLRPE
jgi:ABC-2 type transport system permease protein